MGSRPMEGNKKWLLFRAIMFDYGLKQIECTIRSTATNILQYFNISQRQNIFTTNF